jgi:hypothetical protein
MEVDYSKHWSAALFPPEPTTRPRHESYAGPNNSMYCRHCGCDTLLMGERIYTATPCVWPNDYRKTIMARPTVVVLCGSTRFFTTFMRANYEETMAGRIVLSVGFYPHSQDEAHGEQVGCTAEQKEALDQLHMRKIDLADEVLVLNVGGYIGDSTRREVAYARQMRKPVRWLEPDNIPE